MNNQDPSADDDINLSLTKINYMDGATKENVSLVQDFSIVHSTDLMDINENNLDNVSFYDSYNNRREDTIQLYNEGLLKIGDVGLTKIEANPPPCDVNICYTHGHFVTIIDIYIDFPDGYLHIVTLEGHFGKPTEIKDYTVDEALGSSKYFIHIPSDRLKGDPINKLTPHQEQDLGADPPILSDRDFWGWGEPDIYDND